MSTSKYILAGSRFCSNTIRLTCFGRCQRAGERTPETSLRLAILVVLKPYSPTHILILLQRKESHILI